MPRWRTNGWTLSHKLGTGPIRESQTVCIEHLNGAGMVKNCKLARPIADAGWRPGRREWESLAATDAGWHLLRTLLASKARRDGPTVQAASRWQPTSRTCSECGHRDGKKDSSIPCSSVGGGTPLARQSKTGTGVLPVPSSPPLWWRGSTPVERESVGLERIR